MLTPLYDRIIVKRDEARDRTDSGLYIPEAGQETPVEGLVVAVGSGIRLQDGSIRALELKAGDKVLFGKYAGSEVQVDREEFLIMKESDVYGVLGE